VLNKNSSIQSFCRAISFRTKLKITSVLTLVYKALSICTQGSKLQCHALFIAGKACNNLPPKAGVYDCNLSAKLTGKAAGQGCRARLPGKAAVQGCLARLLGKGAVQGCLARLLGKGAIC
jgi:hypothetical protein